MNKNTHLNQIYICPIGADVIHITLRLARALALVDIRLLDHLVVSRNGHASLAERGWI